MSDIKFNTIEEIIKHISSKHAERTWVGIGYSKQDLINDLANINKLRGNDVTVA